jgi:hypothetical protein
VFLGRPWPGPGEPLWLAEDRAWALALAEVEADACPDCGQPWSEASAPEAADGAGYDADLVRCHACATGATAVEAHERDGGKTHGLHVVISKRG